MAININDNFEVNAPKPTDARYGVYADTATALTAIPSSIRYQGLTVGVLVSGAVIEYWFKDGVADLDLIEKTTGGGGSAEWGAITGTLSSQTDLQDALDAKQDQDNLLDSIAGLGGNGIIVRQNGNDAVSRSIVAGSNKITITNGDGVSGNPSIDVDPTNIPASGEVSGNLNNITILNSAILAKVLTGLNVTGGSLAATDSIIEAFGKVQNQLNSIVGGVSYQGVWNASTNSPTLSDATGVKGHYYVVSVAGTQNLGSGNIEFAVGDWIIHNGTNYDKVDNTDAVTSVNGLIGAVVLDTGDIAENGNLYFTAARAIASELTGFTATTGVIEATDTILQAIEKLTGNANFKLNSAFNSYSTKAALALADKIVINDSEATNAPKEVTINTLLEKVAGHDLPFVDAIVDNVGGKVGYYAKLGDLPAGVTSVRVVANVVEEVVAASTTCSFEPENDLQIYIDSGVEVTFSGQVICGDFNLKFFNNGIIELDPVATDKPMFVKNTSDDNSQVPVEFFGGVIDNLTNFTNTPLTSNKSLNLTNVKIKPGNAQNAGIKGKVGDLYLNVVLECDSTSQSRVYNSSGAHAINLIVDTKGFTHLNLIYNSSGVIDGLTLIGGGSVAEIKNGGVIKNLGRANVGATGNPALNLISALGDNAYTQGDACNADLDSVTYSATFELININANIKRTSGSPKFINCVHTGASAFTIATDGSQVIGGQYADLKLGDFGTTAPVKDVRIVGVKATTFTRSLVDGNLFISGCSENIVNTHYTDVDYAIVGNEQVIADADSGAIVITSAVSATQGQKINVKAINNETNTVTLAPEIDGVSNYVMAPFENIVAIGDGTNFYSY